MSDAANGHRWWCADGPAQLPSKRLVPCHVSLFHQQSCITRQGSGEEGKIVRRLAHAIELAGGEIETLTERAVEFKGGVFSLSRTSANLFAAISAGNVTLDATASQVIVTYSLSFRQVAPFFATVGITTGYVSAHAFSLAASIALGLVALLVPMSVYALVNLGRFERFLERSLGPMHR